VLPEGLDKLKNSFISSRLEPATLALVALVALRYRVPHNNHNYNLT
jgi:hypothetical protein